MANGIWRRRPDAGTRQDSARGDAGAGLPFHAFLDGHLDVVPCAVQIWHGRSEESLPARHRQGTNPERKSVGKGKSVSVRVDLGGRRSIKKKTNTNMIHNA